MNDQLNSQDQLFTLAGEIEDLKAQLKYKYSQLEQVLTTLGVGTYHQDPVNDVVYKVVVPKGRFVEFSKIEYVRTAMIGEAKGSLSKAEAKEAGFVVK